MNTQNLLELFLRDLDRLSAEVSAFSDESNLWETRENISNSSGNLCLHLLGNLNHFIGATLGNTGYVRNRKFEFSASGIAGKKLLDAIAQTKEMLSRVIPTLDQESLDSIYPLQLTALKAEMSTGFFLIHLYGHLNYHLGQINYLRRILESG